MIGSTWKRQGKARQGKEEEGGKTFTLIPAGKLQWVTLGTVRRQRGKRSSSPPPPCQADISSIPFTFSRVLPVYHRLQGVLRGSIPSLSFKILVSVETSHTPQASEGKWYQLTKIIRVISLDLEGAMGQVCAFTQANRKRSWPSMQAHSNPRSRCVSCSAWKRKENLSA